jgi:site-specific DNA recombinase
MKPQRPATTKNHSAAKSSTPKKMVLYARVSTEEQTRGNYPSCDSQIEELEAECIRRGWEAYRIIKDEGHSAGSLRRPGLTEMRHLVQNGQVEGVLCTWYDRLTRSRDFYTLENEFKANSVDFITLHDPADTRTAAGRFMESMIVAAKTYERDQTSEKVRIKMRMRQEKGLHQGGLVPFGFRCDPVTKMLSPDPDKAAIIEQMFRTYIENRSDFAVRDWLQAHQVPSPRGEALWRVSTIRDLLSNRRYIGEIEVNRKNKDVGDLSEETSYRIIPAPHEPLIPREMWEMAQAVRQEKARQSPNRIGKPRSLSQTQCGRVYPLQGVFLCGECGHSMTPWYVHHKPGHHRRTESFIHYYLCAKQQRAWTATDHKNMVLARRAESWVLERINELAASDDQLERCIEHARRQCEGDLGPERERLALTKAALAENGAQIEEILSTIAAGKTSEALLEMLGERATQLKIERERLKAEERRLKETLQPVEDSLDIEALRENLKDFGELVKVAQPEELQRLLRLMVRRVEWKPEGKQHIEFFCLPRRGEQKNWFQTDVCSAWRRHARLEPLRQAAIFATWRLFSPTCFAALQVVVSAMLSIRHPFQTAHHQAQ